MARQRMTLGLAHPQCVTDECCLALVNRSSDRLTSLARINANAQFSQLPHP
jgi:hypothetical protein